MRVDIFVSSTYKSIYFDSLRNGSHKPLLNANIFVCIPI